MTLEETIQLMVKYRVLKFEGSVDVAGGVERRTNLELHPLAFVGPNDAPDVKQGPFGADVADKKCNCSHPLTEHSEHGLCLQGCSSDACGLGDAHT